MVDRIERGSEQEARTVAFFKQEVDKLMDQILGRIFVLFGTNKRFIVTEADAWPKEKNLEKRYKPIHELEAGDLYIVPFPLRKMNQSLIVARSAGEVGACLRLKRVDYYDATNGEFMPELDKEEVKQREGDIAKFLGLDENEVCRLVFLDNSDTLYIFRKGKYLNQPFGREIDPKDADKELRKLIE